MMTRWKVVGWYHARPTDETLRPYPIVVYVETDGVRTPFELGERALANAAGPSKKNLLNWYMEKES